MAILALRAKHFFGIMRLTYWVETAYMLANSLTNRDAMDASIWELLTGGVWNIRSEVRVRAANRLRDLGEADLHDMGTQEISGKLKPHGSQGMGIGCEMPSNDALRRRPQNVNSCAHIVTSNAVLARWGITKTMRTAGLADMD